MGLYRHAAVALTFSPRLEALLAEAVYRARLLEAPLSLIHAGGHSPEKEARIRRAMEASGLTEQTAIHWMKGTPDEAILKAVAENDVDLLLAGALEKERPLRYYLGSVAHKLVRESPCSLMLLPKPETNPKPMRRFVFVTEYSEQSLIALMKTIRLAEKVQGSQIFAIRVLAQYGTAMVLSEGVRMERAREYQKTSRAHEESLLDDLVTAAGSTTVPIEARVVEGHTGFVASQFAREHEADVLVLPSGAQQGHFFERLFPSDMEWVLREIPCNLWVVRERIS